MHVWYTHTLRRRIGYDRELPFNGSFADRVTVYSASANDPQPFTRCAGHF